MNAKEIIENRLEIFKRFQLPPALVRHSLLVASVTNQILNQLQDVDVNRDLVLASAIVHDLGNIAKIDFSSDLAKELYSKDERAYWSIVKEEVLNRFACSDEYVLTERMIKEIQGPKDLFSILTATKWIDIHKLPRSTNWSAKILAYADYRCGPLGLVSLKARLDDLKIRYATVKRKTQLTQEEVSLRNNAYVLLEEELKEKGLVPENIIENYF